MDSSGLDESSHGGEKRPQPQQPCRDSARGAWRCMSSCPARKVSWMCRFFQRDICFHGDGCSHHHLQSSSCRYLEPHATMPGSGLGLSCRDSESICLPLGAMGGDWQAAHWGPEPILEELASKAQEVGGRSWNSLSPSSSEGVGHPRHSQEFRPKTAAAGESVAPLLSWDLQREQDSRDAVCGICMDKVWEKPEVERVFAILPNCAHAHCLGCLRRWRGSRWDFPPHVIKACPQCRVYSCFIIPHKYWVSHGTEKEQLIRSFKARTSRIPCRFFVRGNNCPFKSDCIYLHQLPAKCPEL